MDPQLWIEIKQLVADAAELEPAQRLELLDRSCARPEVRAEVESLLAALDDRGAILEASVRPQAGGPSVGDQVGAYRLLERLGGGGMGEVFLARQESPIDREVAVKFIRTGLESEEVVRRFKAERQALALMGHRGIARIFDVGSHQGRPFLAMEKIEGEPIDRYCDRHRLGIEERLRLFQGVCYGVQHAHMKGVIHRDLKPSNLLVVEEDGVAMAKIIDFGIAKFVEPEPGGSAVTLAGQWLGTPDYMSPEQAAGAAASLDTRSDVFSLGVLLYELLCGALPLDARDLQRRSGLGEWLRAIKEDDPPVLTARLAALETASEAAQLRRLESESLRRRLEGDLDAVTSKALAREPDRRYLSPADLAADIERHLRDEPVLARAPATAYILRKWIRRHRLAVVTGTVLLLSLTGGLAGAGTGLVRARAAEKAAQKHAHRAEREASTANQVKTFLGGLFNALNTEDATVSPNLTLRQLLDRGALRIRDELADQPLVQAELMVTIAKSYASLAAFDPALSLYRDGLEIFRRELGEGSNHVAWCHNNMGVALNRAGRHKEAEDAFRTSLAVWRDFVPPEPLEVSYALTNLGSALKNLGRFDEALEALTKALEIKKGLVDSEDHEKSTTLTSLGLLLVEMGQPERSIEPLEQALAIEEKARPGHPRLAYPLNNLGLAYAKLGQPAKARPFFERAIAIDEKVYGPDHLNVAIGLFNLATLTLEAGDCRAAAANYARTLEILKKTFEPDHPKIGEVTERLSEVRGDCSAVPDKI